MAKLAQALELPVAYLRAVSEPVAESILVMSRLSEDEQERLVKRMWGFTKDFAHSSS